MEGKGNDGKGNIPERDLWETKKIIQIDALELLKQFDDDSIDLIITDPPYGINASNGVGGFGSSPDTAKTYDDNWDNKTPDKLEDFGSERDIVSNPDGTLTIATLEGNHTAQKKDWIIRGVKGEVYPCKPDIFDQTYEEVKPNSS